MIDKENYIGCLSSSRRVLGSSFSTSCFCLLTWWHPKVSLTRNLLLNAYGFNSWTSRGYVGLSSFTPSFCFWTHRYLEPFVDRDFNPNASIFEQMDISSHLWIKNFNPKVFVFKLRGSQAKYSVRSFYT